MSFYKKLIAVQSELIAPKGQYNSFGKYNYRSCEDILEALKPLLAKHGLLQLISDEIVNVGDRYYVKATITVTDGGGSQTVTASAREALTKKGMDDSQITGTASSYARKYALNGMYNIDDSKDADTDEHKHQTNQPAVKQATLKQLQDHIVKCGFTAEGVCQSYNVESLNQLTDTNAVINQLTQWSKQ